MDLQSWIFSHTSLIENTLNELLINSPIAPYCSLIEAARYSVLNPGKRLRPLLVLSSCELLNGDIQKAIYPACAIEILHSYSLIHDDLPCMDDDDLRRGKPTVHKVFGEGHAVLTGDFLLTFSFQVLSESPLLLPEQKIELVQILATRAGAKGVVGGQSVDIASSKKNLSWEEIEFIHQHKTAALLSACLEFGAVIACTKEREKTLMRQIGEKAGLAFQIIDDVLDIEGSEAEIGKPLHSDIKSKKTTAVSILGLKSAKDIAQKLLNSALDDLQKISPQKSILLELLKKLIFRTK